MALQAGERLPDTGSETGNLVFASLIIGAFGVFLVVVGRIRKDAP